MKTTTKFSVASAGVVIAGLLFASFSFVNATGPGTLPNAATEHMSPVAVNHLPVCNVGVPGQSAGCHARVVVDGKGSPAASSVPNGYGPAQFRGAYALPNSTSSSQTIAIVDAYDHPTIKNDLDVYNSQFGLPFFPNCSATVTTGCFKKVDQRGGSTYPQVNAGWALEIALDVQAAHAVCPTCKILLVEADSNSYSNLFTAVDRAVTLGANVVSMSWSSGEFAGEMAYDIHFNNPNVAFTASSGDAGYGTQYPAASPLVTAVGGTVLNVNSSNSYVSESAWSGSGSGCSAYEQRPDFQTALGLTGCGKRMVADVSADAAPSTGAAVYTSVRYQGKIGWFKVGGTSLAAPLIAAVYALAGNVSAISPANGYPYANTSALHDVTSGTNGTCATAFLCNAVSGYDGPTGIGTPNGAGAF